MQDKLQVKISIKDIDVFQKLLELLDKNYNSLPLEIQEYLNNRDKNIKSDKLEK